MRCAGSISLVFLLSLGLVSDASSAQKHDGPPTAPGAGPAAPGGTPEVVKYPDLVPRFVVSQDMSGLNQIISPPGAVFIAAKTSPPGSVYVKASIKNLGEAEAGLSKARMWYVIADAAVVTSDQQLAMMPASWDKLYDCPKLTPGQNFGLPDVAIPLKWQKTRIKIGVTADEKMDYYGKFGKVMEGSKKREDNNYGTSYYIIQKP